MSTFVPAESNARVEAPDQSVVIAADSGLVQRDGKAVAAQLKIESAPQATTVPRVLRSLKTVSIGITTSDGQPVNELSRPLHVTLSFDCRTISAGARLVYSRNGIDWTDLKTAIKGCTASAEIGVLTPTPTPAASPRTGNEVGPSRIEAQQASTGTWLIALTVPRQRIVLPITVNPMGPPIPTATVSPRKANMRASDDASTLVLIRFIDQLTAEVENDGFPSKDLSCAPGRPC